jgi:cytochrome c551
MRSSGGKADNDSHNFCASHHPMTSRCRPGFWIIASIVFFSCSRSGGDDQGSSNKFAQYYNQGQQLYVKNCSNCHQKEGTGLALLYPPLDTSDFMENKLAEVVCLIRYGRKDELIVNGKSFNQPMRGIPSLTDLEIAEITTYIYNTWSHKRGMVDVKSTTSLLDNCRPAQ